MFNNTIVSKILLAYEEGKSTRDPRTRYWLLLDDNPLHVWILTALYVAFVLIGPKVMKNRKPFNLQKFMVVYNFGLVFVSLYLMIEIIASAYDIGYFNEDPWCCKYNRDTQNNPKELRIATVFWWYFLSKLLEFMDTVVMVLRKKNDQITFLHVYHHSSMLNIWWWVTTYLPGGQSWFSSSLNCSVHVIMYLYYALAAIPSMRSKLWWKKYITKYQLVQFVLILVHTMRTAYTGCDYPMWGQFLITGYMISMLILFGNFYLNAYIKKRRLGAAKKTEDSSNGVLNNGVHKSAVNGHSNGHLNGRTDVVSR
ncbi:elongation of very long chain fatty acids protein 2-like [Mizuhopecten yessoensis]|uniref:Elongation of very long chain fatty acids protein n=1 Tax=Mizuhopecten yessoensis TaxID=6573 RepID=A0A210PHS9_MIZYE|nr:elongation of very long chain fatty acids protein 2-like [Mizuhopecten yessoensis]XP_021341321.1 elongation of very long chain fatty acids protein 2-like [Mizuhopecten yessoensis]XP_021341322.1 elongation of very long chain fatty acids protein 2-like [Mizuhopecten yessoensis]OWF36045.1 Elongation of very long chain fatty acids protein 5 [Mizuhopecten yessoensis]